MLGLLGIEEGLNQAALVFGGVAGGVLAAGGLRRAPEAGASIVVERLQGLGPRAVGAVELLAQVVEIVFPAFAVVHLSPHHITRQSAARLLLSAWRNKWSSSREAERAITSAAST